MATPSLSAIIRDVLKDNPKISTDDAITQVKHQGRKDSSDRIRTNIYSVRKKLKQEVAKPKTPTSPKPVEVQKPMTQPKETALTQDLAAVLANITLVNRAIGAAGGIENARQVADAVRSCGGVDCFLQLLEIVAGIRTAE